MAGHRRAHAYACGGAVVGRSGLAHTAIRVLLDSYADADPLRMAIHVRLARYSDADPNANAGVIAAVDDANPFGIVPGPR